LYSDICHEFLHAGALEVLTAQLDYEEGKTFVGFKRTVELLGPLRLASAATRKLEDFAERLRVEAAASVPPPIPPEALEGLLEGLLPTDTTGGPHTAERAEQKIPVGSAGALDAPESSPERGTRANPVVLNTVAPVEGAAAAVEAVEAAATAALEGAALEGGDGRLEDNESDGPPPEDDGLEGLAGMEDPTEPTEPVEAVEPAEGKGDDTDSGASTGERRNGVNGADVPVIPKDSPYVKGSL
jgi:hypothetical protein